MVEIKSDIFDFTFKGHINIICGADMFGENSGRRKTKVFTKLYNRYTNGGLFSNRRLIFIENLDITRSLAVLRDDCVICDETNVSPEDLEILVHAVKNVGAYLIVFGRLDLPQLEFGTQDAYFMENDDPVVLKHVFTPIKLPLNVMSDVVVTEDSWSVAGLFTAILGTNVISAGSKNNIWKKIKGAKYPLIIADEHKFMPALMQIICRNKTAEKIYLFLPASFEEILLDSTMIENYRDISELRDAFDSEDFCERRVKELCNKFDKDKVSVAIRCLLFSRCCGQCKFHLGQSKILQALIDFYSLNDVEDCMKELCYEIDLNEFRRLYFNRTPVVKVDNNKSELKSLSVF